MQTTPKSFHNPHSRRNKIGRVLWGLAYLLLFRPTPRPLGAWRSWLLRRFGARMKFARFHPSARVWAPWLLDVGDQVYIDERVILYNPYGITLGDRVVVSQGTFLCSATHDYTHPAYPLAGGKITVGDDCWIAAEAFVGPGITVNPGAVVGARAVVVKDVEAWKVVAGNPAKVIKDRIISDGEREGCDDL